MDYCAYQNGYRAGIQFARDGGEADRGGEAPLDQFPEVLGRDADWYAGFRAGYLATTV